MQEGFTNGSRQVTSETLNVMGLNWMLQTAQSQEILAQQLGILPQYFHRLGRMAQETGKGYYVDVYMQLIGEYPSGGDDTAHVQLANTFFDLGSVFASSLEHGIIEQLQNTNLVGASTVKMLQIANTNGQAVYLASSTNWTTGFNVQSHLANYDSGTLATIGSLVSSNYYVLMPQNGSNHVTGTSGTWAGYGYEARQVINGTATESEMIIAGGYHGGYSSDPTVPIDPIYIDTSDDNQPTYFDTTPVSTPAPTTADPVDTADDTFQIENIDLSVGQAEPRGITLSRYYNGTRRFSNPAGMAGGWIHNYAVTANNIAAPQACLGGTTPAQAAAMMTATAAAVATYNGAIPDPKNWLATALIAKWGVDQMTKSGVSVALGKDTLQFVQQPTGVFTPPANSTATLTASNSAYSLLMRHGNRFNFNAAGLLTNITDQYSQPLNLTYNSSNWVSTVKDWKNRTFTFNYSGTPSRLTSVSDGTRTVSYGYSTAYNSQGDLTSFADAAGGTNGYVYDTNHQITATLDAQSRLVVSNIYDTQGHLTTQYTQGDTNKTWRMFWSGWQTTEFDPANGEVDYLYDDEGRLVTVFDQLDFETDNFYDGQNHVVESFSPLNELNQYFYDADNNLVTNIDPSGFTNRYVFNSQDNLIASFDARGNSNTFGYNSHFSLAGSTNGAGDAVTYAYNTDGTLSTRTDAGGTVTYGYDSNGQLNGITYPGGLGSESFVNSSLGDVTNHTDARGFVTSFQFNARRQLTNSIGPTNLTSKILFDSVGNAVETIDPRGNVSSNTWSVTRLLLATANPAVSSGTPIVSNLYDNRDWLIRSTDPLQNSTSYTNDADGRLIFVTDPVSRITKFGYNADGRKTSTTNAAGETVRQQWSLRGQMTKLTDGLGHAASYAYDDAGNQIALTNRNSKVWQFQFDGANRLTATITPLGRSNTVAFNHQGLPYSLKDPAEQVTTNGFDAKGRLTNRVDSAGTTVYRYDANDSITNVSDSGLTNSWTYDAYNRTSSCTDVYGDVMQYRYDASGNLTNLIYPGGHTVFYSYDADNRLVAVTDWAGRTTSIAYDLAGHMTNLTRPNGTYRSIAYDAAGQPTNILEQMPNSLPIALMVFNWDTAARLHWEFLAPLPHTNAPAARSMTYDNDDRLTTVDGNSVTVDADGNLVNGPLTNDTFAAYTFDARNRLMSAGGVTNIYDGMNNRVGQFYGSNSVAFVVNPNGKLPQVLMRIKNGVTNYYVYGPGLLYQVTETATATNTLTYHYDFRGSTIALTGDNGLVADRFEYSAYATLTFRAGNDDTPFLFNGLYGVMTDPNGLLFMRARYYSPFLCRFINPDPSGFAGGLNFYAYASGNPINLLDPFGLGAWTRVFGGLRAIGGGIEAVGGFTFAVVTSETVAGAIAGGAVGVHGVDSFQTGIHQLFSGQQVDSLTSQGLQAVGVPKTAANLTDAGLSIVGTAGTSLANAAPATGDLVHLTDATAATAINDSATLIGDGGIYAGPAANAEASGWGVTARTFMNPGDYEAIPIPGAANGAFSSVVPVGPITGWQALTGQVYTQGGTLDLATGVFTQTGLNWGQAAFGVVDATFMNAVPAVGTAVSSGTGK